MKKWKWLIILLVLALVAGAVWFWKFRKKEEKLMLETELPQYGTVAISITATGTIQPVDTVSVGTQVSGTIAQVYADFNSAVKKGQLLAQLDKILLQAQVQQFSGSLQQAKSNLVYQQSNYNRQKQLLDVGAISRAEYETALYQLSAAKDNIMSAEAQLKTANRNLQLADIYSPIDGTVLSRNVSAGQTVVSSLNAPTLFVIARDLMRMQVQAAIDEADIGNVKKGQRVTFSVDAYPEDEFEGVVKEIRLQPSISSNVVTYVTIIDAPNDQLKLKPGMTASITVYTKEANDALLVSARAIKFTPDSSLLKDYKIEGKPASHRGVRNRQEPETDTSALRKERPKMDEVSDTTVKAKRAIVWLKNHNVITRRVIQVGLTDDANVQILQGLTTRDTVITGIVQPGTLPAANNEVRSPFMPARRGGGNRSR
ncbi:efflux RND transporter periplasmic adaptor subunit [Pseudobacter ginsenosidimutans]|uniref:HlyD family secretion protein n=1 Tax=Pseudobacter ginsenosidimutans TaxID=661488 RepID=A0A4Q7MPT0_9BACT|nr:efflux RND transporter periplasmic adaptor subunit [Pseudobacter ginsenosidimutans]QEC42452.1 efflux RND transporter periplasmic adaptor subunit [Pseudobacter ginsenosidimutans]RZS70696.1 HlyD family secretion protein [Pseudobacter ginsenosidimutans]